MRKVAAVTIPNNAITGSNLLQQLRLALVNFQNVAGREDHLDFGNIRAHLAILPEEGARLWFRRRLRCPRKDCQSPC